MGVAAAGAAVCLLVLTVLHAALGRFYGFDVAVQAAVHGWPAWLYPGMRALTGLGRIATFVPAVVCVAGWLCLRREQRLAAVVGLAMAGALVLNEGAKVWFHRARPPVSWALGDEHTYSFPSGHALFSVVLYGTLCGLALRAGVRWWRVVPVAVVLPVAIGLSRVYLGEHWPTDVIGGWLCGAVWGLTVLLAERPEQDV